MFHTPVSGTGEVFLPLPGGCAYNTSIAVGRLGAPVTFLGRLSTNFFGEIQINRLRENNVNDKLIIRCGQNPVLAFIKVEECKEPQYAFYDEATADRLLSPEELPPLPADTSCLMFGSISMSMEPIATTIESLIFKEANQKVIAFDPNIRPFMIKDRAAYLKRFEKWVSVSTIVKISLEDFEYIDSKPQTDSSSEKTSIDNYENEALAKLTVMGARLAIITLGPNGCKAKLRRDDGSTVTASSPGIPVANLVDTVGAGDTFLGALLSWLELNGKMSHNAIAGLSEDELQTALAFANKAASIVCARHGAEPPTAVEMSN
jgi:fructokinase